MDGATLQARIYSGYAKAALRIGQNAAQYRAASASDPLNAANLLRTIPASFNAEDMTYSKPNKYGHPTWYGLFDGSLTQVGDYLTGAFGTYFIAAQQQALPILCVQCNRVATVTRASENAAAGLQSYNADVAAQETTLMTAWPCSILQGTKGEKNPTDLPGDTRSPWVAVLMPAWPGVILRTSDILTDDIGNRYIISSAELTDLGWRMTAANAQT